MFDQVVCARMYHSSQPHVSWQALVELRRLLHDSLRIDVRENVENQSPPTTEGTDEAGTRTTESSALSRAVRSAERSASVVEPPDRQPKERDRPNRADAEAPSVSGRGARGAGGGA
jgi:hypothetical protein